LLSNGIGFNTAAPAESGFKKPAMLKITLHRILEVGDHRDKDAVGEDETTGFALVAVDGHAHELTS
jgi:hypothetical protein